VSILVEACVETLEESIIAERAGAGRLELCANMDVGGTTPSAELFQSVRARVRIPIAAMVRPRGGSFVYSAGELEQIWRDLDLMKSLGADVLVFGILNSDGSVNRERTRKFVERASPTPVTMHLAFDAVPDHLATLDFLMQVGVARVLTSGGAGTAAAGVQMLGALVERGGNRISIMAGGKVRAHNVAAIVRGSGVREVHARSEEDETRIRDLVRRLSVTS
jgi:copper homeostasis protein